MADKCLNLFIGCENADSSTDAHPTDGQATADHSQVDPFTGIDIDMPARVDSSVDADEGAGAARDRLCPDRLLGADRGTDGVAHGAVRRCRVEPGLGVRGCLLDVLRVLIAVAPEQIRELRHANLAVGEAAGRGVVAAQQRVLLLFGPVVILVKGIGVLEVAPECVDRHGGTQADAA